MSTAEGALAERVALLDRLLWGSDWPHTPPHGQRVDPRHSVGFREVDTRATLCELLSWLDDSDIRRRVLVENPAILFGFPSVETA